MDQIRGVQLEQPATERRELILVFRNRHHLHAHEHDGRRVVDDERKIELAAGFHDPQSGLRLAVARAFSSADTIEEAFDVFLGDHRLTWFEVREGYTDASDALVSQPQSAEGSGPRVTASDAAR